MLFNDYDIEEDKNIVGFIKKNYLLLIGLSCIMLIYFLPPIHYLVRIFPFIYYIPLALMLLKYTILYVILSIDLFLLYKKHSQRLELANSKFDEIWLRIYNRQDVLDDWNIRMYIIICLKNYLTNNPLLNISQFWLFWKQ